MALWDPLNAWPKGRRWIWAVLAGLVCLTQGPKFISELRPARDRWTDFFQEWASARNYACGLPIYSDHQFAVERHLGYYDDAPLPNVHRAAYFIKVNAHPPTAILLALPLASLDYPDAVLVWNLVSLGALFVSLWLVARALAIPLSVWSVPPLIVLLLLCNPFREQVYWGQLNLILLLLLTGTWICHRSNRPIAAGILLGLAAAIKLFPAFLFLFFLLRRQWKTLAAGMLSCLAVVAVAAAVLGMNNYWVYVHEVIPQLAVFRSGLDNASLPSFWTKLFNPSGTRVEPLWINPTLAQVGTWLSCGLVVAVLAWLTLCEEDAEGEDRAFALTVTAMLLVSPITWNHYLLLLLVPLAVAWTRLTADSLTRWTFVAIGFFLWACPFLIYQTFNPQSTEITVATAWQTLYLLALPCYAILGLFALLAKLPPQSDRRGVVVEEPDSSRPTADLVARAALPCSSS
jgi:hypothetical protein